MSGNPDKTDYSGGIPASFATITGPRDGGNTLHHFGENHFIPFAVLLCGVGSYELSEGWLRKWLKLPNGTPTYNTFSRVFQAIAPTVFASMGRFVFV